MSIPINNKPYEKKESCPFLGALTVPRQGLVPGQVDLQIHIPNCIGEACKFWGKGEEECLIKLGLVRYLSDHFEVTSS